MLRASLVVAALSALTCANTSAVCDECARERGNTLVGFSINPQEFSEDDALDRFEVDEWFLPKLNIELPALFDWSAGDSAYYANARHEAGERTIGLC